METVLYADTVEDLIRFTSPDFEPPRPENNEHGILCPPDISKKFSDPPVSRQQTAISKPSHSIRRTKRSCHTKPPKSSRKQKAVDSSQCKRISIRCTQEVFNRADQNADRAGKTKTQYITALIMNDAGNEESLNQEAMRNLIESAYHDQKEEFQSMQNLLTQVKEELQTRSSPTGELIEKIVSLAVDNLEENMRARERLYDSVYRQCNLKTILY